MKKSPSTPSKNPAVKRDPQAKKEADRAEAALDNVREGYGGSQNDRSAGNQSGMGSQGGARDMTSGKRSGNQ
jgi:hypothetical protein